MSANSTPAAQLNATPQVARRTSVVSSNDEARQQVAWQREMERAQLTTWFKPPVVARADTAAPAPSSAAPTPSRHAAPASGPRTGVPTGRLPPMVALPGASLAASLPVAGVPLLETEASPWTAPAQTFSGLRTATLAQAAPEARAAADPQTRRAGGPVQALNQGVPGDMADARTEAADEPRSSTLPSADAQAPLRLHEESMPEGQAVWIAMRADDDALAAMLPRIVADLQRDMQQARGQRLHQVVCNGRLVWRDGATVAAHVTSIVPGGERRPTTMFDSFQSKGA